MSRFRRLLRPHWLAVYLVVVLTPPVLVLGVEKPRLRNLAVEISGLTGLMTLSMLVVALALPTPFTRSCPRSASSASCVPTA